MSRSFNIAVIRGKEYLNWKYIKNPTRKFKIYSISEKNSGKMRGYVVLSRITSTNFKWGRVVDFVVDPTDKEVMQILITHTVKYFEKQKCDGIQIFGMKKEHRKMFRKNGFINLILKKQRFIIKIDRPEPDIDFFKNPENWFITAGDSDFSV